MAKTVIRAYPFIYRFRAVVLALVVLAAAFALIQATRGPLAVYYGHRIVAVVLDANPTYYDTGGRHASHNYFRSVTVLIPTSACSPQLNAAKNCQAKFKVVSGTRDLPDTFEPGQAVILNQSDAFPDYFEPNYPDSQRPHVWSVAAITLALSAFGLLWALSLAYGYRKRPGAKTVMYGPRLRGWMLALGGFGAAMLLAGMVLFTFLNANNWGSVIALAASMIGVGVILTIAQRRAATPKS